MDRALRRARSLRIRHRREFIWNHVWKNGGDMHHSFMTTMRPCSCAICKRDRYDRNKDQPSD